MTGNKEKSWWAPLRKGLFADPDGKHCKQMGNAIWLYGYLHVCADRETGKLDRKYQTISTDTGISMRTLQRMMKRLEKFGYVEITRKPNHLKITITRWISIGKNQSKRTANSGGTEPPYLTSAARSGESLNVFKERTNEERFANSGASIKTPFNERLRPSQPENESGFEFKQRIYKKDHDI
jgi:hypothetical protein